MDIHFLPRSPFFLRKYQQNGVYVYNNADSGKWQDNGTYGDYQTLKDAHQDIFDFKYFKL